MRKITSVFNFAIRFNVIRILILNILILNILILSPKISCYKYLSTLPTHFVIGDVPLFILKIFFKVYSK